MKIKMKTELEFLKQIKVEVSEASFGEGLSFNISRIKRMIQDRVEKINVSKSEESVRNEAFKAGLRSQLRSDYIYDHKSYEDGFYEGRIL